MREVNLDRAEFAGLSAEVLSRGGLFRFKARGTSMTPFIQDGDILTIQPVEAVDLRVGQVAFYRDVRDKMTAHRVIRKEVRDKSTLLLMRGDAALGPAERIRADQVLGRVVRVQRGSSIIHPDRPGWQTTASLWRILRPLPYVLFWLLNLPKKLAIRLLRRLQGFRLYRLGIRKLILRRVHFDLAMVADATALSAFYGQAFSPALLDPQEKGEGQLDGLIVVVARSGAIIVGAAIVREMSEKSSLYPDWWLSSMLVRGRYRGAGIGGELVRLALETLAREGAHRLHLLVFERNRAAIDLYRKAGFRQSSIPDLDRQLESETQPAGRRRLIMSRRVGQEQIATMRPEDELLVCVARAKMDVETGQKARTLLRESIDWDYLIQTALRHKLMPLLYRHLRDLGFELIPESSRERLKSLFHTNARRNIFIATELFRVLNLLRENGIPAIPYKGLVLAAALYGDPGLRQIGDLDFLVRRQDVPKARDLLLSLGYRSQDELPPGQEAAYLRSQSEYNLVHPDRVLLAELHWAISPKHFSFSFNTASLWERVGSTTLLDVEVPDLAPEDLLLILCVHGAKHLWERLEWICGVAELVRMNPELPWGQMMESATHTVSRRVVLLGLTLAHDLLAAPLPDPVLQAARHDPTLMNLAAQVRSRLFATVTERASFSERSLFYLRTRERLRDKVRYCFGLATTPTVADWQRWSLPPRLSFLYYLLPPAYLSGKTIQYFWRRFAGD